MTDRQGDLVQHYGYYPFGDERYSENSTVFLPPNLTHVEPLEIPS
jgi:hypothetical protein